MNKIINIKNTLVTIIAVSLISCNTSNNSTSKNTSENPFKTQVDSILNLMTLDEKIGQLNLPATGPITTGSSKSTDVVKKIEDGLIGGLFNIKDHKNIYEVQKIAVEKNKS